jgi:hypothetical protein
MTIAIPSVASIISNSRNSGYVDSANSFTDEVRRKIASRKLNIKRNGNVFIVPVDIIGLSSGANKSPYGEWTKTNSKIKYIKNNNTIGTIPAKKLSNAFVLVKYDSNKKDYLYYFTSIDETGHVIKPINIEELKPSLIEADSSFNSLMTFENITVRVNGANKTITKVSFKTGLFPDETTAVM